MKKTFTLISLLTNLVICGQTGPEITSWLINTTGSTGYGGISSNVQTVQYNTSNVFVSSTGIPDYSVGPWTANPNTPSDQSYVFKITRNPAQNTGTAVYTGLGATGLWSNGVVIYNAKDGYYWNNTASTFTTGVTTNGWNRNAKYYEGISFDGCLGHPDGGGAYHLHVNPTCLYNDAITTAHSPIIGYAFDGYPIYGAYAYTNTNGTGAIKRMLTSYVLSTASSRALGPPVNSTYPLGSMCEDYVYTAGSGDLDEHNGRYCITPEYPSGTYAYFVTIDAAGTPEYPFVIGPTYYGTVQTGNTGPTGGNNTIPGGTTTYVPSTVGINTVKTNSVDFSLFPNPANTNLQVSVNYESTKDLNCKIYNSNGVLVYEATSFQPDETYSIDITGLSAGLYIVVLEGEGALMKKKIIITN